MIDDVVTVFDNKKVLDNFVKSLHEMTGYSRLMLVVFDPETEEYVGSTYIADGDKKFKEMFNNSVEGAIAGLYLLEAFSEHVPDNPVPQEKISREEIDKTVDALMPLINELKKYRENKPNNLEPIYAPIGEPVQKNTRKKKVVV